MQNSTYWTSEKKNYKTSGVMTSAVGSDVTHPQCVCCSVASCLLAGPAMPLF